MTKKEFLMALCVLLTVTVIGGCICSQQQNTGTGQNDAMVCNRPYIQVGSECCLDRDGNGICDKDETTTTEAPTTTAAPKTTQAPTTTLAQATTTSAEPTTTTQAIACSVNSDCGATVNYTKCYNGNVIMYWETPACTKPSTTSSQCIKKSKTTPVQTCGADEKCFQADCINQSSISCGDACLDKGYTGSYCYPTSACTASDSRADLGDISCSPEGSDGYCCCKASTSTTNTTTSMHTACIAAGTCAWVAGPGTNECSEGSECLGAPAMAHSTCSGGSCIWVAGSGSDDCSTDSDCVSSPSITFTLLTHKACVGNKCVSVFGIGANECTTNFQCTVYTPIKFHNICQGGTCVATIGSGSNACTNNLQCLYQGPGMTITPVVTLPPVVTIPHVVTTIKYVVDPGLPGY